MIILLVRAFFLIVFVLQPFVFYQAVAATETPITYNREIPVVVVQYFPELSTRPGYIDHNIAGPSLQGQTIAEIRTRLAGYITQILIDLTNGTKWQGYAHPERQPSLRYVQHGSTYEYIEALPRSNVVLNHETHTYRPNYRQMLERINICDLVDNQGVKQVWVWGYHHGEIEPVESNMSMGTLSRPFFTHGTYGDISNSERSDDLPQCAHTYILSNYNYTRGVGEALEDHGHHIESILNWMDGRDILPGERWNELLFWGKFVGSDITHRVNSPGCGWIHTPPNGTEEYGWYRETAVQSDCLDWKPDRSGAKAAISCHTWAGATCSNDGGRSYKVWWMQNIPGAESQFSFAGRKLRNWWDVIYDLDAVLQEGGGLFVSTTPTFTVTSPTRTSISITIAPQIPSYHLLKLEYKAGATEVYALYKMPQCSEVGCTYTFENVHNWTAWRLAPDTTIPYNTPRSAVSISSSEWEQEDTEVSYRSWIIRKVATPTPSPSPTPLLGDLNDNGKVDIFDYNSFLGEFGKTAGPGFIPADIVVDGVVDIFDYNVLLSNFGKSR